MGLTHKRTGTLPQRLWTRADSQKLGLAVVGGIKRRIHTRGEDAADAPLPPYKSDPRKGQRKILLRTGTMQRGWKVKAAEIDRIVIGHENAATTYATHLQNSAHSGGFAGLSPADKDVARKTFGLLLRARRTRRGDMDGPEIDG